MGKTKDPQAIQVDALNLILELREVIEEGRCLLRDLATERRYLAAERKAVEDMHESLPERLDDKVNDRIKEHIDMLGVETQAAITRSADRVSDQFNELFAAFTSLDTRPHRVGEAPSLAALAQALATVEAARATPHL